MLICLFEFCCFVCLYWFSVLLLDVVGYIVSLTFYNSMVMCIHSLFVSFAIKFLGLIDSYLICIEFLLGGGYVVGC